MLLPAAGGMNTFFIVLHNVVTVGIPRKVLLVFPSALVVAKVAKSQKPVSSHTRYDIGIPPNCIAVAFWRPDCV